MEGVQGKVVPGRWLVNLRAHASPVTKSRHMSVLSARTADLTPFHCQVEREFDLPECRGYSATFDDATKEEIERLHEVASVEPVQLYRHCSTQFNAPWGLARISKAQKLSGNGPYSYTYRENAAGEGVIAYVLDTGINVDHVEFEGRASRGPLKATPPREGVVIAEEDVQGHGTHCAGTIASRKYGVAKQVEVVGVKVFNDLPDDDEFAGATNDDIIMALEYVVQEYKRHGKPSVVNLSLGGGVSEALDSMVSAAVRAGVVVCCAAGNATPPTWIPRDAITTSPARTPLAITVGATNVKDELADFSYYGKLIDILAPGVDILSTWVGDKEATKTISGTSMACPHVVGVACCLLSDPTWADKSPSNVMSQVLILADKNKAVGISGKKIKTIDALLQLNES